MRRILIAMLAVLVLLCGCNGTTNAYEHERFTIDLPDNWQRTADMGVVAFAKDGVASDKASITFYATEKNYYFETFTQEQYNYYAQVMELFDEGAVVDTFEELKINGWNAHRVAYSGTVDSINVRLVLYSIDADMTYIFTLLQPIGAEDVIASFDNAMKTVKIRTA